MWKQFGMLILAIGIGLPLAGGCASPLPPAVNVRDGKGYCPACHEWHEDAQLKFVVLREGKTYRFCDPNCVAAFERNPDKFLKDSRFNPQ